MSNVFGKGDWYFVSDPHFGHGNIIKYCNRPFMSFEEQQVHQMIQNGVVPSKELMISKETIDRHDDAIINSINSVVMPNDILVIQGDFTFCDAKKAKEYRDRIYCKNIILIYGNHDKTEIGSIFSKSYHQYLFNVGGQKIFCSHYPCRSWDSATHGSWMLYGHVHNALSKEDNGDLLDYERNVLENGFKDVLKQYNLDDQDCVEKLLAVCASLNGVDLTLDVGVDNTIRKDVPFGTPWSMHDIRKYMSQKIAKWADRRSKVKF